MIDRRNAPPADADARTAAVRRFYTDAPFPNYGPRDTLATLRARAARSDFARRLDEAIAADARVLDLGCGTGQMTIFLASGGGNGGGAGARTVVGADMTRASLELGAAAARRFGVAGARFVQTDLRRPALRESSFDVVLCTGVLHHTPDPRASFAAVARLVRPGGVLLVGLYNAAARLPHRLRRLLARATGFRRFPFDPVLRARAAEPARRAAWLRDQYLHPEEHRHTVGEVQRWFRAHDIQFLRTFPGALVGEGEEGAAPSAGAARAPLFAPADDDWWLERGLAQLGWMRSLAHEGGLFVAIGRRAPERAGS